MAVHIRSENGGRAIGSHIPLNVALAILPSLPRPILARLVDNAIDLMDTSDGDADDEPEFTEQDDEPEDDDHLEEDDHGEEDDPSGGSVDDEGEPHDGVDPPEYGVDQSRGPLPSPQSERLAR